MSVKGEGGVPPKSVTFFLAKILSVKGGGTPLTNKIRKVVFEVLPEEDNVSHGLWTGEGLSNPSSVKTVIMTSRRSTTTEQEWMSFV